MKDLMRKNLVCVCFVPLTIDIIVLVINLNVFYVEVSLPINNFYLTMKSRAAVAQFCCDVYQATLASTVSAYSRLCLGTLDEGFSNTVLFTKMIFSI